MSEYKTVGIRKLKNELSAYIRDVKDGSVILVTDHGNVVAEFRQPGAEYLQMKRNALRQKWIDSNKLHIPQDSGGKLESVPINLPSGTAMKLLDSGRGVDE